MTASEEEEVPKDLFKDVTFYIVGDIAENVRITNHISMFVYVMYSKMGGE